MTLVESARNIRLNILRLAAKSGAEGKGVHIAPSLSCVEILTVLFLEVMRPQDVFVLSKGHGGLAYYCTLKEAGVITEEQWNTFESDAGDFPGQPSKKTDIGIVFSSGSLGMGLSYACGLAFASKRKESDRKIYVLLGDGELNEGSNWEAVMFAKQQKLDNLVAVVDYNGMQSDGTSVDIIDTNLEGAFSAFGWSVRKSEGHSVDDLEKAFGLSSDGVPTVVLAKTVKGKGVSFMENSTTWHHNRLTVQDYEKALEETNDRGC